LSFFKRSEERVQTATIEELKHLIASSRMPQYVQDVANKELETLSKISPSTAEYTIGLTYIDYIVSLPWSKKTQDNLDIRRAEEILNARHFGLQKIKQRVLEHLAVKILTSEAKPKILVVDDEKIALEKMQHALEREDYSVVAVDSGEKAFKKIESDIFDVVITDLRMENVDGIDILEKTRNKNADTQIILITGYASIDSAKESIKKGAFDYIEKPLRLDTLRTVVKQALEKKFSTRATKGYVLCFAGPPGTGKTSLGRAIADALGRKFARISLGGIKDEAEIRGHRRTYAGAMPGRIIEEIRRADSSNPVLMLDELDKIGQDFKGDSASALLEVLDPEQNHSFIDHYLDVPFDLSSVMFIGTANIADNIQEPLLDRMEIVEFSGYTEDEKREIASRFLISKQIQVKGLSRYLPGFTQEAITKIIQEYTREAGIRNLERQIATVCRKIATELVNTKEAHNNIKVTPELVEEYLGTRKYYFDVAGESDCIGIATGLVWTEVGGAIIFVEAAKMKGSGELILTGSLGNVMRESAQAALSFIRSKASSLHIPDDFFDKQDIHVHVPAGAIPKDGPSAGATIAIALISLLTGRPAKRDVAVSGEITLSGRLLPVAGIKEKLLAARQAGVKSVVLPLKNRIDLAAIVQEVKKDLNIISVDSVDEIIDKVLVKE
jgi:ATP-dependent Lon protease